MLRSRNKILSVSLVLFLFLGAQSSHALFGSGKTKEQRRQDRADRRAVKDQNKQLKKAEKDKAKLDRQAAKLEKKNLKKQARLDRKASTLQTKLDAKSKTLKNEQAKALKEKLALKRVAAEDLRKANAEKLKIAKEAAQQKADQAAALKKSQAENAALKKQQADSSKAAAEKAKSDAAEKKKTEQAALSAEKAKTKADKITTQKNAATARKASRTVASVARKEQRTKNKKYRQLSPEERQLANQNQAIALRNTQANAQSGGSQVSFDVIEKNKNKLKSMSMSVTNADGSSSTLKTKKNIFGKEVTTVTYGDGSKEKFKGKDGELKAGAKVNQYAVDVKNRESSKQEDITILKPKELVMIGDKTPPKTASKDEQVSDTSAACVQGGICKNAKGEVIVNESVKQLEAANTLEKSNGEEVSGEGEDKGLSRGDVWGAAAALGTAGASLGAAAMQAAQAKNAADLAAKQAEADLAIRLADKNAENDKKTVQGSYQFNPGALVPKGDSGGGGNTVVTGNVQNVPVQLPAPVAPVTSSTITQAPALSAF